MRRLGLRALHTFRTNEITGDWVVYAQSRGLRPKQTSHTVASSHKDDVPAHVPDCPFCAGNEDQTPPALLEYTDEKTGSWALRVVPNKSARIAKKRYGTKKSPHAIRSWASVGHERRGASGIHRGALELG